MPYIEYMDPTEEGKPQTATVSGVIPMPVAEAIRAEAAAKERSVSWVLCRICTEWYRQLPGAQVELKLVPETVDERGGGR